jgi:hypothetical protein
VRETTLITVRTEARLLKALAHGGLVQHAVQLGCLGHVAMAALLLLLLRLLLM